MEFGEFVSPEFRCGLFAIATRLKGSDPELLKDIKTITHKTDDDGYSVAADGALIVDGICIYEMTNFSVVFNNLKPNKKL
jgi:hypothetical protein